MLTGAAYDCRIMPRKRGSRRGFSLGDREASRELVRDADALVHLAFDWSFTDGDGAVRDLARAAQMNVIGSIELFEAARDLGVRHVIFASSGAVYGDNARYAGEQTRREPSSHYGACKLAVEAFAHAMNARRELAITVVRFAGIMAPTGSFAEKAKRLSVLARPPNATARRPKVHLRDVCATIEGRLRRPASEGERIVVCSDVLVGELELWKGIQRLRGGQALEPSQFPHDPNRDPVVSRDFGGVELLQGLLTRLIQL